MVKKLLASVEDVGSIPGSRSPGGENGNPLQYSCLKKSIDSGAYWAAFHGVAFPSAGDLFDPGIKPASLVLQADSLPTELSGTSASIIQST